jgi:hypothetical protein
MDDKARFPRRLITLCIDGVCIMIGALLRTSPLIIASESAVGIKEGGRTGELLPCGVWLKKPHSEAESAPTTQSKAKACEAQVGIE